MLLLIHGKIFKIFNPQILNCTLLNPILMYRAGPGLKSRARFLGLGYRARAEPGTRETLKKSNGAVLTASKKNVDMIRTYFKVRLQR